MRIDVITPSLGRESGGVGAAVFDFYSRLVLNNSVFQIDIKCLNYQGFEDLNIDSLRAFQFQRSFPRSIGYSYELISSARNSESDIIHTHGIWMATSAYQNFTPKETPRIISPHGMMDPWIVSRGKVKKFIAKSLYENKAWKNCSVFHALNEIEADGIRALVPDANIVIIPNGIDVPEFRERPEQSRKILFLGRFHEKKNLHGLVAAVNSIPSNVYTRSPFKVTIAGWGDSEYEDQIKALIHNGKSERFEWFGAAFGEKKAQLFREHDAFILPSYSEGLPVAILEAWASGLTVLKSANCNLQEAFSSGAALESGTSVESIAKAITDYITMPWGEVRDVAERGHNLAQLKYSWDSVLPKYREMYEEVVRK